MYKWMCNINYKLKKWRLGEASILENWYRGNALEKMEWIYV